MKLVKNWVTREAKAAPTAPHRGISTALRRILATAPVRLIFHSIFCRVSARIQMLRIRPIWAKVTYHTSICSTGMVLPYSAP